MASWESRRIAHERAMYKRLRGEFATLAGDIGRVVLREATDRDGKGQPIVPNTRTARRRLSESLWRDVLRPYFIGSGDEPLIGYEPQSPYMRLTVDGVKGAIEIQAARQVALIKKYASPKVWDWLTGPRPLRIRRQEMGGGKDDRTPYYDPFHLFVNPNGYTLSDNGWNTAIHMRAAIDNLLDYEIPRGTAAVDIAKRLEPYLWPEAARVRTYTPYGDDGSYWARRLARTEITAASGRSFINAALANPYVTGIKWNLSLSHPEPDICDTNAHGGDGNGVYAKDSFPAFPAHPNEMCFETAEVTSEPAAINASLEGLIEIRAPEAEALRGAFNTDWLIIALLTGAFNTEVLEGHIDSLIALARAA